MGIWVSPYAWARYSKARWLVTMTFGSAMGEPFAERLVELCGVRQRMRWRRCRSASATIVRHRDHVRRIEPHMRIFATGLQHFSFDLALRSLQCVGDRQEIERLQQIDLAHRIRQAGDRLFDVWAESRRRGRRRPCRLQLPDLSGRRLVVVRFLAWWHEREDVNRIADRPSGRSLRSGRTPRRSPASRTADWWPF